jgi:hypothetical protein
MGIAFFILFSFFAVIFQVTILSDFYIWGAYPNLILALLLAGVILDQKEGKGWYFFMSVFLLDFIAGRPLGFLSFNFWLVFVFANWLVKNFIKKSDLLARFSLLFAGIFIFEVSQLLFGRLAVFLNLLPSFEIDFWYFCLKLVVSLLINGLLSLACIWFFDKSKFFKTDGWTIKSK